MLRYSCLERLEGKMPDHCPRFGEFGFVTFGGIMKKKVIIGMFLSLILRSEVSLADSAFSACMYFGKSEIVGVDLAKPSSGSDAVLTATYWMNTKTVPYGPFDKIRIRESFDLQAAQWKSNSPESCLYLTNSTNSTRKLFGMFDINTASNSNSITVPVYGATAEEANLAFTKIRQCLQGFKMGIYNHVKLIHPSTILCFDDSSI